MLKDAQLLRLRLNVAGADAEIEAPAPVIDVVARMLGPIPRTWRGEPLRIAVRARFASDVWKIAGSATKSKKTFANTKAIPHVAGAVVSSLVAELAYHRKLSAWRGAALERGNNGIALVGEDWETIVVIAAHLHTRGWRILGTDHVLVDPQTFVAEAFRKLMHANSFCGPSFPRRYRTAIEASPWYAGANTIEYYAVDPGLVEGTPAWGDSAPIRAVVRIDGHSAEYPALEVADDFRIADRLRRSDVVSSGIECGVLVRAGFIETCDFLERWFASLA
ncbi:MAG: hypothetical protein JO043_03355 [Candidatus Eremiobacteraeota bacterium]|nr:hypothetical protein [Candidatus Eremiobacteraeota bacterium]